MNPALSGALNWLIVVLVMAAALLKCGAALSPQALDKARRAGSACPRRRVAAPDFAAVAGPMYNSYNWGGYLVWALPEEPVFVDGRTMSMTSFCHSMCR